MKRVVTNLLIILLAASPYIAMTQTADAAAKRAPVHIVNVTGNHANGFKVTRSDGSQMFTPTRREAMVEVGEQDTRIERAAGRAAVRTQYRMLTELRKALRHA